MEQRVRDIGLGDLWNRFKENHWHTMGNFAYASSYIPGGVNVDAFKAEVVQPLLGDESSRVALVRRLHNEAYTAASAMLVRQMMAPSDEAPRSMPEAELDARRDALVAMLPGLPLDSMTEPSHQLIDIMAAIVETAAIKYPKWEKCTRRRQELVDVQSDKFWKPGADGTVREHQEVQRPTADFTDVLSLRYVLTRRSIAMDIAGLCMYEAHELWVEALLEELTSEPPDGFLHISTDQLQKADTQVWEYVATKCWRGSRN